MLKYCLFAIKENKIFSVLKFPLQSVCVYGCIYSPFVYVTLVLVRRVVIYNFMILIMYLLAIFKHVS